MYTYSDVLCWVPVDEIWVRNPTIILFLHCTMLPNIIIFFVKVFVSTLFSDILYIYCVLPYPLFTHIFKIFSHFPPCPLQFQIWSLPLITKRCHVHTVAVGRVRHYGIKGLAAGPPDCKRCDLSWDRSRDLRIPRKASWPLTHRGALILVNPGVIEPLQYCINTLKGYLSYYIVICGNSIIK